MTRRPILRRGVVPRAALLAVLLLLGAVSARAQEIRPSEPIPLDELGFGTAPQDTVPVLALRFRESEAAAQLERVPAEDVQPRNPRNAAIRSFLIPGWGQVYTGHPIRAVVFAVSEVGFFLLGRSKQQDVLDTRSEIHAAREEFFADTTLPEDPATRENLFLRTETAAQLFADLEFHRERRDDFYAYAAASVIFAAVDAYVAAQLDPIDLGADVANRRVWAGLRLPVGALPGRR